MPLDEQALFQSLDPILTKFAADRHTPGLILGIVADGGLAHARAIGRRSVRSGEPVTVDTTFRVASMTKMFTALGLLHLRDRSKLHFDEPVENIVPELVSLRYPTSDCRRIRIRDLLSHVGGFVTDDPWGDRHLDMSEAEFSSLLRSQLPFARAPGIAHEYSNLGSAILGRVITNRSGQRYDTYLHENFLRPLDMPSSTWEVCDIPIERRAVGHSWIEGEWVEESSLGHGAFGAMGGLHTTARDYAHFVAWLLSAWPPRDDADDSILARSSIRELAEGDGFPQIQDRHFRLDASEESSAQRYGLGIISVADAMLGSVLTHSGGLPGYGSNVLLLPNRGVGLFLFANITYARPAPTVRELAVQLVSAGTFPERTTAPSPELVNAGKAVRTIYGTGDIEAGGDILAMNVLLDCTPDRWRRELARLHASLGDCTGEGALVADSAMAGAFTYPCERGHLRVQVLLAPTVPAKIQKLEISILPLT